jgi:UrcA family protein
MNTETQLTRRSISRSTSIRATLVAMLALVSAGALADQPQAPAARLAAKISLADLDLSTPDGARAAYERIRTVAKHLCFELWDNPYWQTYDACVHESLTNAVRRMNTPALAAVQEPHTSP